MKSAKSFVYRSMAACDRLASNVAGSRVHRTEHYEYDVRGAMLSKRLPNGTLTYHRHKVPRQARNARVRAC